MGFKKINRLNKVPKWSLAVAVLLILTGCAAVGPDYVPPDPSLSDAWHSELKGGLSSTETDPQIMAGWWTALNDPVLSNLIERAASGSLSLKEARARVWEARARRGIYRADKYPSVSVSGSASATGSREVGDDMTETYKSSLGFDASWELDLFGSVRRSVEAAEADLQASQENLRDVLVTLFAEIARNYVEVRTYQTRLTVAEESLEAQQETYNIARWLLQAGMAEQLDLEQAAYSLESTKSQLPSLRTGLEEAKNRLAVLVGEQPGAVHQELEQRGPIPVAPLQLAVGVPADLLRRRPDLRRAERELAAQTARVGVATADLYPKFSLSGSIGLETVSSKGLFSGGTQTYAMNLGPSFSWPIFNRGAIRQNIEVQNALQEQTLIQYESAVLNALEEVENALKAFAEEQNRKQALDQAASAARRAVELAQSKYRAGLIGFGDVLDAQRSLLSFRDNLAQSEGTVTTSLIALYKALGGGWDPRVLDKTR